MSKFQFCHNLSLVIIWVLSQFEFSGFVTFWVLSQFNLRQGPETFNIFGFFWMFLFFRYFYCKKKHNKSKLNFLTKQEQQHFLSKWKKWNMVQGIQGLFSSMLLCIFLIYFEFVILKLAEVCFKAITKFFINVSHAIQCFPILPKT